ncbi:MAG: hypothetical protein EOP05_12535 [Proteobacteria bacterium]|nr:MAG: hypothetical protein EOP05_12535 [Pseudomonadota bacterium]
MRFLSLMAAAATVTAMVSFSGAVQAQELDNEAQVTNEQIALSKDIPATLVVRTNPATGEVQVLHSNAKLAGDAASTAAVADANFAKVDASAISNGELDKDSSSSSWYFCFNRSYSYPAYYYGGYNYAYNYYSGYNWGGWNYSYYRWNYGWWY